MRAVEEATFAIVEVQDTGQGIPKKELEKIFLPYQHKEYHGDNFSGLGLGLPLSQMLVELHGGKMWVESRVGEGTTFRFSVPFKAQGKERKPGRRR